jgi:GNAT superfamily N-acetyltransferase
VLTRPLVEPDWPHIAGLEAATYRELGLSEGLAALRSRAGAGTSFVLEVDGAVAGYLLALPYPYGRFPDLATLDAGPSPVADLHLHDMAVAAEHRRAGLGTRLAGHLLRVARELGYERVSLVALDGRDAFWARRGFVPQPSVPAPTGYGPGATYMSLRLQD